MQLYSRFLKFMFSCTKNNLLCLLLKVAINGSNSIICRNINHICTRYNIDKYDVLNTENSVHSFRLYSEPTDDSNDSIIVNSIRNSISYRDDFARGSEDYKNIDCIIKYLCEH